MVTVMDASLSTKHPSFYGQSAVDHFGMAGRAIASFELEGQPALVATHLHCRRQTRERTRPVSSDAAYSVLYQLSDLQSRSRWLDGRLDASSPVGAGEVEVVDLRDRPQWQFSGDFHALQFYISLAGLSSFAKQCSARTITSLSWESGVPDDVLSGLSNALIQAAATPSSNQLLIDQLAITILTHFAETYGGLQSLGKEHATGLAPWQLRRATEIMAARLASNLKISQIASECRLTPSHFARAFRHSMGVAPQRYLTQLRIEEARKLLPKGDLSLSDIALVCGFGDQSHFTHVFKKMTGESPGAWRRLRASQRPEETASRPKIACGS
ncbi:helix-turn-helix transcriptional regulator [Bosea sp. F3-2]|uniref:helix-turn-helix domain-containing protein n=1 Tax=Bosea sp. F3-2 TaxID=2599640 RepID=UPI0011EEA5B4|nr:AraC family transcriptional regulator [Bosea sp. F3-2]QEL22084.1 helix-turn-helix transcriptional regulator [Bosea sp. F3-2]